MTKQEILFALDITHPGGAPIKPGAAWETRDDLLKYWAGEAPAPTEAELLIAFAQHEANEQATAAIKHWPNVQSFMAEFLSEEIHAIANATIPEVITSRFLLSTWLGHVVSNDPRITQGLDILLHVGIITNERRQQIITVPT